LNRIIIVLCSVVLLAGCKAHKQVLVDRKPVEQQPDQPTVGAAKTPAAKVNTKLVAIRAKQVNFNTFSGKAKAKLDINGDGNDVTLNIHIQRDKKIWVSVTAILGVEVARALITPDSMILINRLQGVYMKKPISYIYQYGGRQINYKTLESLLVGNAIPELLNDKGTVTDDNANTVISGNLQEMIYKLIIGPDFKASQTSLSNNQSQSLQVTNGTFIQADGRIIPSQVDITSALGNKKITANLHYVNAEFDKVLEYPFSIPDRYTLVD
jgi:hypothetical protein